MKIGLVLASLVLSTTAAYAQAPGDYYDDGEVSPPGMAPTVAPEPPPPPVRQQRWSIGLNVGSMSVAPHMQPENPTEFSVGQLALRYRPWRHLEIELALGGGREQLEDGTEGDRELSSSVLALRYRFNPQRPWNMWLMAGMGSFAVASQWASDEEKQAAVQSTLQFGVGLERRWSHFALQIELRAVGVAPNEETPDMPIREPIGTNNTMSTEPPKEPYPTTTTTQDGWKGGQTTIGASYYF
ncbi:MAG TPA: hypothetical protein VL326_19140 [Kofleriaceae bacterium]|jgi:hypothetical protein|nr:hypothetical protein [Kofleriaceae bacterium]